MSVGLTGQLGRVQMDPSASGALIKLDGVRIWEHSEYLGSEGMSNNCAEYAGIIAIFGYLIEHQIHTATVYGDSNMVINGNYIFDSRFSFFFRFFFVLRLRGFLILDFGR